MAEYKGTVELIGGLTPKNNGSFPLASAKDIQVDATGKRLDTKLAELEQRGGTVIVTVDGLEGTASHSATEIYALVQANNTVVAVMTDTYNFQYKFDGYNEPTAANSMQATVKFIHTAVDENGLVTTDYLIIHENKSADAGYYTGSGGANGLTPHIGANGNWYIGDDDTGVKAEGAHVTRIDEMGGDATKTTYKMVFSDGTGYDFDVYHGQKGDKGDKGDPYTLTEDDKSQIVAQIGQIEAPTIVSSIEEMTDTSKHYVLNGYIWHNKTVVTEGETVSPNLFVASTAKPNGRLSGSSGSITNNGALGCFVTDFIKVEKWGETTTYYVRFNGELLGHEDQKFVFYDSAKTKIGNSFIDYNTNALVANGETVVDVKIIGSGQGTIPADDADVAWVRFQLALNLTKESITVDDISNANFEITFDANRTVTEGTTTQEWVDSGISYTPTFKTDLIGVLGENNAIYLSDNLPSGTYTLKYGDDSYDTIGTITVD